MSAVEQLREKLAKADSDQAVQRLWIRLSATWLAIWALIVLPITLLLDGEPGYGAGITVFFAGAAAIVLAADRVARRRVSQQQTLSTEKN